MAYVLPVRPFTLVRAFGFSAADASNGSPLNSSSLALRRHLKASCPQALPSLWSRLRSTNESLVRETPRLSFRALQQSNAGDPSFHSRRLPEASEPRLPCDSEVPSSGFGYPLDGLSSPASREPLSALATLGLRPSELCSSSVIEKKVSLLFFRSGLFPPNLPGLMSRLQRLGPTEEAVPPPASPTV
jgi:hypothetical protein